MASYAIEFRRSAERDLRRLDPSLIRQIIEAAEALAENPFPHQTIKLQGAENTYRLRVGRYRVIYEVDQANRTVIVYYVRHRREAYREL